MAYEKGMSFVYNRRDRSVTGYFRGQKFEMRGPFNGREAARAAYERRCRQMGRRD